MRFVQIYHKNWDVHGNLPESLPEPVQGRRSGLLRPDPGPEAARPARRDARHLGRRIRPHDLLAGRAHPDDYGRDHHPRCFTMWMAGGGLKRGLVHGETDDFSYNIVNDPVHVRDFHATVLHLLGIDHERFTYKYQGLDQKLTGVEKARVVQELLS